MDREDAKRKLTKPLEILGRYKYVLLVVALGAALLAAVGCGVYRDYGEAVSRTIRITRVQEPDWANHEKYQRYMELYLKLYEDLKADFPLFQ